MYLTFLLLKRNRVLSGIKVCFGITEVRNFKYEPQRDKYVLKLNQAN